MAEASTTDPPPKINKWDGQTVKNTLDDEIRRVLNDRIGWAEVHSLMNGRLFISIVAVLFSAVAIAYDYVHPFPKSRMVLGICSISYFILMGVLQLYQWYIEKNTFYQALETDGANEKRRWKWNSDLPAYDDKYTLSAEYVKGTRSGCGHVTKSIANFINEEGEIVRENLEAEVVRLYDSLTEKEN